MSTRIKLRVQGLANSQIQSGAYALILAEENGPRRIPIIVGTAEAQSIAIALEHIVPPRPLTHDLFATFAQAFNVILKEVYIYKFEDGVFYSELEFSDGERSIKLDSRTSDAIAIALRVNCDIFTSEEIVKECGVVLEDTLSIPADEPEEDDNLLELEPDEIKDEAQLKKWLSLLDIQEINERLEDAIADENYEYAKMYKDEKLIYTMGSGSAHSVAYSFAICLLMEMQWINSGCIHSGEYFHGPFEVTDYDVPFMLVKSIGHTRHLDERVENFAKKFTEDLLVLDQKDLDLSTVADEAKPYVAAILTGVVIRHFVEAIAFERGHSLDVRRYMWQMQY